VTDGLVERIADEIARGRPERIVELPLIQALAKDHVRQTQERLIGTPLVQRLNADVARLGAAQLLMALLAVWRRRPDAGRGCLRTGSRCGRCRGTSAWSLACRFPLTVNCWQAPLEMRRSGSGRPAAGAQSPRSRARLEQSGAWCCPPTATGWSPAERMGWWGCGTQTPGGNWAWCTHTAARFEA